MKTLLGDLGAFNKNRIREQGPLSLEEVIMDVMNWDDSPQAANIPITRGQYIDLVIAVMWIELRLQEKEKDD